MPAVAGAVDLSFPAPATPSARQDEALGSYRMPVGPWANGKMKVLKVEGPLTRIAWRLDTTTLTTLQILAPLRDQLLRRGFVVLYECATRGCGGFDFRYGATVLPEPDMHVDLGDFRYLAAERPGAKGLQYVSLLVSRSAGAGFVQVTQVGSDPATPAPAGTTVAPPAPDPASSAGGAAPPGGAQAETAAQIGTELSQHGFALLAGLRFASGSAELSAGDYPALAALAEWMKADPGRDVTLVGHTDTNGTLAGNIALSKRRATSVMERLIQKYGVPKDQLDAEGVGYLAPRSTNLTPEGRTKNRRVEAILTSGS